MQIFVNDYGYFIFFGNFYVKFNIVVVGAGAVVRHAVGAEGGISSLLGNIENIIGDDICLIQWCYRIHTQELAARFIRVQSSLALY